ncbi:MAG: hypothetical protein GY802_00960 [Gammaproteobacteria bacterium]|nr:hypothetical protein [Gammaproteobacteria bacterium]
MFLKQIPRYGDWKVLAASLFALTVAGCANLSTAPDNIDQTSAAVTIPLQTQDPESDIDTSQYQNFDDFSEAAAFAKSQQSVTDDALEFPASAPIAAVPMNLDIELEAEQAELALKKQQRAEAEVVAAIEASLQETRRKNNAWHRLQNGMQLTPVENQRI